MGSLVGFLIAILILVTVHEWGHFIVARFFGVKVLKFAVGFGKPFWSYLSSSGTKYQLCLIPLGGYVKMLDSRELEQDATLSEEEKSQAFDYKPCWQRILIVLAGPVINLILSIFLFAFVLFGQNKVMLPIIGQITDQSIAQQVGLAENDIINKVDNKPIQSWQELQLELITKSLSTSNVLLEVRKTDNTIQKITLPISQLDPSSNKSLYLIGIQQWQPKFKATLGKVLKDEAADDAGLKVNDTILSVESTEIIDWSHLVSIIQQNANKQLTFTFERNGLISEQKVKLGSQIIDGEIVGLLGAAVYIDESSWNKVTTVVDRGIWESIKEGYIRTIQVCFLIFESIISMFSSKSNLDQLGGPVTIAQQAGTSLDIGWRSFVSFLALLSVSLAIFNLLPIPVLDGGHIVLYLWEMLTGKAVSKSIQLRFQQVGVFIILSLMVIAFSNDFMRLF